MSNALGNLFTDIANSIRGGLGGIGKMSPSAFPSWINELVAMIGSGEDSGGSGDSSSSDLLKFARGTCSVSEDGTQVTVEHGLGCMPDLIIFQLPQIFSGDGTVEDVAGKIPLVAAWGIKSTFDCSIHSGKVTSVYGLTSPLGIDNMSEAGAAGGYIYCPDEETFRVGATGDGNSKLYAGNNYTWLAVTGIGGIVAEPVIEPLEITENGTYTAPDGVDGYNPVTVAVTGGNDVRYVTFMNHDGTVEYGKKAVAVGDDCADPIARGVFDTPTRESDVQYNYTFAGWATEVNGGLNADALKEVNEDRTVYANFAAAVRYYTISFYDSDGTTLLATKSVAYGSVPSYTPTKDGYDFAGWEPELVAVTGEASYTATWTVKAAFGTATWAEISEITTAGTSASYFAVGDTRSDVLTYSDGSTEEIEWEIVQIRDDGTMVLALKYALETLQPMDSSKAASNYFKNDLGDYITNTVVPALSEEFSAVVRPVYEKLENRILRLPSVANVRGTALDNGSGVEYVGLPHFATQSNRIRTRKSDGVAVTYWLSNSAGTVSSGYYYFGRVETNGTITEPSTGMGLSAGTTTARGVVLLADV